MGKNLYEKVFDSHTVRKVGGDQYQIFIGLHLLHEATTAPAFSALEAKGLKAKYPDCTFATADHIIPTTDEARPFKDQMSESLIQALEKNTSDNGIRYFSPEKYENGIVHVIGPEKGLTQPGMTICCGDSHTSTHGAFGAIAMGIGTTQVRDVLATQSLITKKLKTRKVEINGNLATGVTAKDAVLYVIKKLGVRAGIGYAYEFCGSTIANMSMDERMTICNMSVEGGARVGYVNPDKTTFDYIEGRQYAPKEEDWDNAVQYWQSIASDKNASFDDEISVNAADIKPMTTWGVSLEQSVSIDENIPDLNDFVGEDQKAAIEAANFMGFELGKPIKGIPINVAFIGSCTNGRASDFEQVANLLQKGDYKVPKTVKALIVPGSQQVLKIIEENGWDKVFSNAGFEMRKPGCSMCLAMNPDKLEGNQLCASASNRNFKGRQGSPAGRTLIMSPLTVAASAVTGVVSDPREVFKF